MCRLWKNHVFIWENKRQCIAVYIRLSSEDNDVDGSIKAESNSVSAQRMLINEFIKKQDEFINCSVVEYVDDGYSGTNFVEVR